MRIPGWSAAVSRIDDLLTACRIGDRRARGKPGRCAGVGSLSARIALRCGASGYARVRRNRIGRGGSGGRPVSCAAERHPCLRLHRLHSGRIRRLSAVWKRFESGRSARLLDGLTRRSSLGELLLQIHTALLQLVHVLFAGDQLLFVSVQLLGFAVDAHGFNRILDRVSEEEQDRTHHGETQPAHEQGIVALEYGVVRGQVDREHDQQVDGRHDQSKYAQKVEHQLYDALYKCE